MVYFWAYSRIKADYELLLGRVALIDDCPDGHAICLANDHHQPDYTMFPLFTHLVLTLSPQYNSDPVQHS